MDGHKRMGGLRRFLGGLPTGQRLAAVTIVVVMIASGWWLGTSRPVSGGGMEPVLDRSFSIAELTGITERLRSQSIPHEIREDRVYVPTARRMEALADLYEVEAFREGSKDGFGAMINHMSALDPPGKTGMLFNEHRQERLASIIMGWPGVRKARVIIDSTYERRLNGDSIRPVATVDIQTRGEIEEATTPAEMIDRRQLADAAVNAVSKSVASLSPDQVMVTIDGASYGVGAEAAAAAREAMEHQQRLEQVHAAKLRQLLQFIPNVVVSVSVGADRAVDTGRVDADLFTDGGFPGTPGARTEATGVSESDSVVANAVPTIPPAGAAN